MKVNAVVAAGAPARFGGSDWEALLEVGERRLLESVILALRGSSEVQTVVVVAPEEVQRQLEHLEVDRWLPAAAVGYRNMLAGLDFVEPDRPCLMCVADLPFAHRGDLSAFLAGCDLDLDVNYGVTRQTEFHRVFPGCRRRFVPLQEGRFTGAGLGLIRPGRLLEAREHFRALFGSRKNTFGIALRLGLSFLVRRVTGSLTLPEVESRFSDVVGLRCRAVECDPFLTLDVDTPEDLDYAAWWAARRV